MNNESASVGNVPPLEYLREAFSYDPESGKVFWKDRPLHHFKLPRGKKRGDRNIGKEAGTVFRHSHHDSVCGIKTSITYGGKLLNILMHHVAWRLTNGDIPAGQLIDHIDHDPTNNRIRNLRLATASQNGANMRDRKTKSNGLPRGVYQWKKTGKFWSKAVLNYKSIYLGTFDTPEEARDAFLKKCEEIHGEFFKP